MDLLNNKNRLKKEGYDEQKSGLPYKRGRKCFFAADNHISADSLSSFPSGMVLAPYRSRQVAVASSGHFPQQLFMSMFMYYTVQIEKNLSVCEVSVFLSVVLGDCACLPQNFCHLGPVVLESNVQRCTPLINLCIYISAGIYECDYNIRMSFLGSKMQRCPTIILF